ncbi:MAG: pyridoxal 5'-phosphate synthase glutaminase subunit PdxT [Acutalibacteraceae bacterium]|nr:pyridoxal 5'-phosphate synthase glutaminase subunit PdxT [Clostridiales bacterium]
MRIGVLAVQGAFAEHADMLRRLGAEVLELRRREDVVNQHFDGLILPGGESTVMGKLLRELDMFAPLREEITRGLPVFGTCAGMILLAKTVVNDEVRGFGCMDIAVRRNAYGRQLGSFSVQAPFAGIPGEIPMVFIRAPYMEAVQSAEVKVLASVDGHMVAAQQGNMLAVSFHPELTGDERVHRYFLENFAAKV